MQHRVYVRCQSTPNRDGLSCIVNPTSKKLVLGYPSGSICPHNIPFDEKVFLEEGQISACNFMNYCLYARVYRRLDHIDNHDNITETWVKHRATGYKKKKVPNLGDDHEACICLNMVLTPHEFDRKVFIPLYAKILETVPLYHALRDSPKDIYLICKDIITKK